MSMSPSPLSSPSLPSEERLVAVEAALAEERARTAKLQAELEAALAERDRLRASHERLRLELELLRRRIFVAKAERVDTTQLELEFKDKLAELDKLAATAEPSDARPGDDGHPDDGGGGGAGGKGRKTKPTGRRDLRKAPLEEERIELNDPLFEALVTEGKAERIGYEESSKLAWKRGGLRRLVVARVKYRATGASGQVEIETTPMIAPQAPRDRPRSRPHRCRPRASRARSPPPRCSPRSSPTSSAMACPSIELRTASPGMASPSIAARCAGGSRMRGRPRARRSWPPLERKR